MDKTEFRSWIEDNIKYEHSLLAKLKDKFGKLSSKYLRKEEQINDLKIQL